MSSDVRDTGRHWDPPTPPLRCHGRRRPTIHDFADWNRKKEERRGSSAFAEDDDGESLSAAAGMNPVARDAGEGAFMIRLDPIAF
jgi:hypothetical protein